MWEWIKQLFSTETPTAEDDRLDAGLAAELAEDLKKLESLYRAAGELCRRMCPEKIDGEPEKFPGLMVDLHRGLLTKLFTQIAGCDRSWHAAEREMVLIILQHIWGVNINPDNVIQVLRNADDHAEMLAWESLIGPFGRMPPLANQIGELHTLITRISNLIAKADGRVSDCESRQLREIESQFDHVLGEARDSGPKRDVANAGRRVAQLIQAGSAASEPAEMPSETPELDPKARRQLFAEAMRELNAMVGLETVKADLRELMDFLKVQTARGKHDLAKTQVSLHTVFTGNPGTGKTTVARILGQLLAGLHQLQRGHTVETDRAGLVAEYAGQTGPRVNERVDEALDGVLFVDEAYSLLAEQGDDPFGSEAIQVLLKRIEDDRDRLVVVLAGYPEPIDRLLRSNPGLSSRFQRTVHFPDYTAQELTQIFLGFCKRNEYVLTKSALRKLTAGFQAALNDADEHFGNGRLVRNCFEKAIRRMATRIVDTAPLTREILMRLEESDIDV